MKAQIDCVHCYLKQAVSCMRIAGIEEAQQYEILYDFMDTIRTFDREKSPAENSTIILHKTYERIGIKDPYKEAKQQSNDLALGMMDQLQAMLKSAKDPLKLALKISVAGNVIDLGIHRDYDIHGSLQHSIEKGFSIDHYEAFLHQLEQVDEILFLGDNAGEIVFDRILVEVLVKLGKKVVYVVKQEPILNDATMEDALYTGMDQVATVITNGTHYLGTCLEHVSEDLKTRFEKAGLVISKGQANFETMEHLEQAKGKVFFMLKLKCEDVAKAAGGRFGDVVFLQR